MKRLSLFVISISLIASSILLGQQLPTVVDNSQWFPPARQQFMNNCTSFSMVYYLKSYIWNRALNRNPNLEENQFSPLFVWNQIVDPIYHFAGWDELSSYFLTSQGAATISDFNYLGSDPDVMPPLEVRRSALNYRSGDNQAKFCINYSLDENNGVTMLDSLTIASRIEMLKDSLNQGKCFTVNFTLFNYFNNLYGQDTAVYSYIGEPWNNQNGGHAVAVTGYDENIGLMGSFKCINSFGPSFGNQGYFYLDFNWFFSGYSGNQQAAKFLLNEKFNYIPEAVVQLDLNNFISGMERERLDYPFVDTLFQRNSPPYVVDILTSDWLLLMSHYNLLKLTKVNGSSPVNSSNYNYLYFNRHNDDGNYSVLFDISDYISADDFSSVEFLLYDPISGIFMGDNNEVLYQYSRNAICSVDGGELKLKNGKKITFRVKSLPDTSVVAQNYSSMNLSRHVPSGGFIPVKISTCVAKRWLITFNIADTVVNNPPVIVNKPDTLVTHPDSLVTFQVEAMDPDGDSLRFSVAGQGASIDSITGLFKYIGSQLGSYDIKIMVTDGQDLAVDSFIVRVDNLTGVEDDFNIPAEYALAQNYPNPFNPSTTINFSLPRSSQVLLRVYNVLGQEVATLVNEELSVGNHSVSFDATGLATGLYIYKIQAGKFSAVKKMLFVK